MKLALRTPLLARRGWLPLALALAPWAAGCTGGDSQVGQPDFTVKKPDLGLRELCPPKPPPPGTLTPEEAAKRDKDIAAEKERHYQEELAQVNRVKEEGHKQAEVGCAALVEALRLGKTPDPKALGAAAGVPGHIDREENELIDCFAVAADSDVPCGNSPKLARACKVHRALVHQTKVGAAEGAAVVAEATFELCKQVTPKAPCAAIRDSIKSRKPEKCPMTSPEAAQFCSTIALHDPAKCPADRDKADEGGCTNEAKWIAVLAKDGAAGLAATGKVSDKAIADAAAGKADACLPLIAQFSKACVSIAMPAPPKEPQRPQDVPGAVETIPEKQGATKTPAKPTQPMPTAPGSLPVPAAPAPAK